MKKNLIFTLLILLSVCGYSQSKIVVGIMPFTNSSSNNNRSSQGKEYITSIQDMVAETFLSSKKFTLVEREKIDLIYRERQTQQTEDFLDGDVVEQSKSIGASFIVSGNVTQTDVDVSNSFSGDIIGVSIPKRSSKVIFSLKVLDVTTGEVVATERFSGEGSGKMLLKML